MFRSRHHLRSSFPDISIKEGDDVFVLDGAPFTKEQRPFAQKLANGLQAPIFALVDSLEWSNREDEVFVDWVEFDAGLGKEEVQKLWIESK